VSAAVMAFRLDGELNIAVASGGNAQINEPRGGNELMFTLGD